MSSERLNFFSFSDDKLYYDEKRKRFVNSADQFGFTHRQYYQNHFKDVSVLPGLGPSDLCSDLATTRLVRPREERVEAEV